MSVSLIAAVAKNGVIGSENDLPWYIPEDLKHFKELTTGKICLMGRKTYESIMRRLGKPLPNRLNILVTRDPDYKTPSEVIMYDDLEKAILDYKDKELFIIGGAQIYTQTMDSADILYITHVEAEVEGDAYFPKIDSEKWEKIEEEKHESFSFAKYVKK